MKVVIIEDEPLAVEKLERYLLKCNENIEVLATLNSLETAIPWIETHQNAVELFFMDVQLTDGLSFEIFSKVTVTTPVIFTTAFDEFAIDAFKVNSIDYLLKPITFTDLTNALKKLHSLKEQFAQPVAMGQLVEQLGKRTYKDRFMVQIGNHIHSIPTAAIAYFYAEGRDVYLKRENGKKYLIDYTLETLEELLEPKFFIRTNRSFIVQINAIEDVVVYANRRLKLTLNPSVEGEVLVSREKVVQFKHWFEGV
ncbi:MAG: DNA-binding response regulator [Flavobacteriaceae bacterium]|nr:MAG: DNA-binding response regulator [Flavobacteriaceae bacterium]